MMVSYGWITAMCPAIRKPALGFAPKNARQGLALARSARILLAALSLGLLPSSASATPPRFAIAPAGNPFPVQNPVPGNPGETARHFVQEHAAALGISSPNISFGISSVRPRGQEQMVHLREVYDGVPIFGTAIIVQMNSQLKVDLLINGILPDTAFLDQGGLSLSPEVSSTQAINYALLQFAPSIPPQEITVTEAQLRIFDPRIFGISAPAHLVWDFQFYADEYPDQSYRVLIDAHLLGVVRAYPMIEPALNRKIYDANSSSGNGSLVRDEGDPASSIANANDAYDFLGDTYNFYLSHFGRDSFDDGGHVIKATVRYCEDPNDPNVCPLKNAWFDEGNNRIYFGKNETADDIVAHEYTHGVTKFESGLIYENASGALNESLSDMFGQAVDLTNGAGTDDPNSRWLQGEDGAGGTRDMKDPTTRNDPDRMSSPNYVAAVGNPNDNNDQGGVHTNSGVSNKLFYLITDGDSFNGYTVSGMGLDDAADLFYAANTRYLYETSDFYSLYDCLQLSATHLGWSTTERNNLYHACKAVEIAIETDVYVDYAAAGLHGMGFSNVPYAKVSEGVSAIRPGDRLHIREGTYSENLRIEIQTTLYAWDGPARIGTP